MVVVVLDAVGAVTVVVALLGGAGAKLCAPAGTGAKEPLATCGDVVSWDVAAP